MIDLLTFEETEKVLLKTIHTKGVSIKKIAEETGVGLNGLYKWSSGASGISRMVADKVLIWLKENKPEELMAATKIVKVESILF